ncbi:MAG: tRNA pseudouridine(38-40) synthase TruA [Bacillota bacterium]|nr:tRNA pseudouridine(38-40) synthase TruA [Bacillota bacterium]
MRNIKLTLMYDGTNYHGWQRQQNVITVQQCVEEALERIFQEPRVIVYGCSRTDAGVHARAYVCSFFTNSKMPAKKIPFALNTCLPRDIRAVGACDVDMDFHAQYRAKSKIYSYTVINAPHGNAFLYNRAWHYPQKIDMEKVKYAASFLVGRHDFRTFMAVDGCQKIYVKNMYSLDVHKDENIITFTLHADGYLYNMVRIICGTLVFMGSGTLNYLDMPDILASLDRRRAGMTAPPQGLILEKVFYDPPYDKPFET